MKHSYMDKTEPRDVRVLSEFVTTGGAVKCAGVVLECEGHREREPSEFVHIREEAGDKCLNCGALPKNGHFVWTDSAEMHRAHPARCLP